MSEEREKTVEDLVGEACLAHLYAGMRQPGADAQANTRANEARRELLVRLRVREASARIDGYAIGIDNAEASLKAWADKQARCADDKREDAPASSDAHPTLSFQAPSAIILGVLPMSQSARRRYLRGLGVQER